MRLIMVASPEGLGNEVAQIAFSVGIKKVSRRSVESQHSDGKVERKEVVDIETSTPLAKRFKDKLLAAEFFNREDFTVSVRGPRSIISATSLYELTKPLVETPGDILEELWQFSHITYGFVGRVFISACFLAYGLIEQKILLIIAGLLFLPLLPLLLAVSYGILSKRWKLAGQGALAFLVATVLLVLGGVAVAAVSKPPLKYDDFNTILVSFLISAAVGVAGVLANIDDVGRREMIGLAATAQIAIIPVWFGICLLFGFPATTSESEISSRALTFAVNVITIIVVSLVVYYLTGAARSAIPPEKRKQIMLTVIENGEIYAPEHLGKGSVLLAKDIILKVGEVDRRAVKSLGVEFETIDARGCLVTPGFIDPHEHLLGGSGEKGFSTQTPELSATEIIRAGITTVVGCLGVDTTMKTMAGLLAKAKALNEEGLNAFLWTGGYDVPPTTITGTARKDIMFIREIIGAGEIAISDERSTDHIPHELARLVIDTHNGGMLSKKAGVTHFHVGKGEGKLAPLRNLLEEFDVIKPEWLYPTHITRSEELMLEAIELTREGTFVDIDTVEEDLPKWLKFYRDNGGDMEKLTVSSDASITSPQTFFEQIRACILNHGFPVEQVLRLVTANTAKVLELGDKGEIKEGNSADILILEKDDFELREVISGGNRLLTDGKLAFREAFLDESNRDIRLKGKKKLKTGV